MTLVRIDIKIYYDTKHESEASIVEEIESWEGIEDVQVLGTYRTNGEVPND